MKKTKKFLAAGLATVMTMGCCSMGAFASNSSTAVGDGDFEGWVDQVSTFTVNVPTADANQFNFFVDPNGLLATTNYARLSAAATAAAGQDVTIAAADVDSNTKLYFDRGATDSTNNTPRFGNESKPITMTNLSSFNVAVSVAATIADNTGLGVTMLENQPANASDVTAPSVYLAIKSGSTEQPIIPDGDPLIDGIAGTSSNYEIKYENNAYLYKLKAEGAGLDNSLWQTMSFNLTGDVYGNWNNDLLDGPTVNLVYKIVAPNFTSANRQIKYMTDAVTEILKVEAVHPNGTFDIYNALDGYWNPAEASVSGAYTTLTFDDNACALWLIDGASTVYAVTITYKDISGAEQTASINLNMAEGPNFSSPANRQIRYKTAQVSEITSINFVHPNGTFDLYNGFETYWSAAAAAVNGAYTTLTFDGAGAGLWDPGTYTGTITYKDVNGDTKVTTVDVDLAEATFTSSANRTVTYKTEDVSAITSITFGHPNGTFDLYNGFETYWTAATATVDGAYTTLTFDDAGANLWDPAVYTGTITYQDAEGNTKVATIDVNLAEPVFTSAAPLTVTYKTANVTEITSIEFDHENGVFDLYNALGTYWTTAASAVNGEYTTLTFDAAGSALWSAEPHPGTVTYKDASGATQTATVNVVLG